METFRVDDEERKMIDRFMEKNKIQNRSEAIRECIKRAVDTQTIENFIFDINNKINRLVAINTSTRKLLEQFFANMGFKKNIDVKKCESLEEFKEKNNKYGNNFLG